MTNEKLNLRPTFEETLEHEKGMIFPSDMSVRTINRSAHHDNVIKALEKQIPKKPVLKKHENKVCAGKEQHDTELFGCGYRYNRCINISIYLRKTYSEGTGDSSNGQGIWVYCGMVIMQ